MPWCPNCKTEYREGFYTCSDCESGLVDDIDTDDETEIEVIGQGDTPNIDWEYLDVFADEQEAEIIESFLNSDDINTFKKYPGFSGMAKIVGGMTRLGVEIYVPKERLEDARIIADDILGIDKPVQTEEDELNSNYIEKEPDRPSFSLTKWLFIGVLIVFIYTYFF